MTRQYWRPANLLNPVPAVMISCADENGNANVMNAAWGGIYDHGSIYISLSKPLSTNNIINL